MEVPLCRRRTQIGLSCPDLYSSHLETTHICDDHASSQQLTHAKRANRTWASHNFSFFFLKCLFDLNINRQRPCAGRGNIHFTRLITSNSQRQKRERETSFQRPQDLRKQTIKNKRVLVEDETRSCSIPARGHVCFTSRAQVVGVAHLLTALIPTHAQSDTEQCPLKHEPSSTRSHREEDGCAFSHSLRIS